MNLYMKSEGQISLFGTILKLGGSADALDPVLSQSTKLAADAMSF